MDYLKEDGSLDVEYINGLPIKEYMNTISNLNDEQYEEYLSKIPIHEAKTIVQPIISKSLVESLEAEGMVDIDVLINNCKKYVKET